MPSYFVFTLCNEKLAEKKGEMNPDKKPLCCLTILSLTLSSRVRHINLMRLK